MDIKSWENIEKNNKIFKKKTKVNVRRKFTKFSKPTLQFICINIIYSDLLSFFHIETHDEKLGQKTPLKNQRFGVMILNYITPNDFKIHYL